MAWPPGLAPSVLWLPSKVCRSLDQGHVQRLRTISYVNSQGFNSRLPNPCDASLRALSVSCPVLREQPIELTINTNPSPP